MASSYNSKSNLEAVVQGGPTEFFAGSEVFYMLFKRSLSIFSMTYRHIPNSIYNTFPA